MNLDTFILDYLRGRGAVANLWTAAKPWFLSFTASLQSRCCDCGTVGNCESMPRAKWITSRSVRGVPSV
jgi:hypothetical protein